MRTLFGLLCTLILALPATSKADDAKILKVLPHFLDAKGRHTLSPSLYERDAYQARLRNHPELVSGLRFDVQWKPRGSKGKDLKLRLELRGGKADSKPMTIEEKVKAKGLFTTWSKLSMSKQQFQTLGGITAWRATLWDGEKMLNESKSFLW
jgi:hypothetical protein